MKLASMKTITFSELTAGNLDNAIDLWIQNYGKEKTFVQLSYSFDGATFTAILIYTE